MYFPRNILPLGAAIEAMAAAGGVDDPADALRRGALIAQGLCTETGRISPIPAESWRRPFIRRDREGKPLVHPRIINVMTGEPSPLPPADPFIMARAGDPIPIGAPPFSQWVYAGIARADIEKPAAAENKSPEAWMKENVTPGGWKRDQALEACRKATGCTVRAARDAWNDLTPEMRRPRGRSKKADK